MRLQSGAKKLRFFLFGFSLSLSPCVMSNFFSASSPGSGSIFQLLVHAEHCPHAAYCRLQMFRLGAHLGARARTFFRTCGGLLRHLLDLEDRFRDLLNRPRLLLAARVDLIRKPLPLERALGTLTHGMGDFVEPHSADFRVLN